MRQQSQRRWHAKQVVVLIHGGNALIWQRASVYAAEKDCNLLIAAAAQIIA